MRVSGKSDNPRVRLHAQSLQSILSNKINAIWYIMATKPPKSGTTRLDVGSAGVNTPLSKGDKREATSPSTWEVQTPRKYAITAASDTFLMDDDDNDGTSSTGDTSLVHALSQPINPLDIVKFCSRTTFFNVTRVGKYH